NYALTVKENQKELVQTPATPLTPGKFSPSGHDADPRADAGTQSEPAGNPGPGMPRGDARTSEFSWSATDCTVAAAGATQRQAEHRNGVSDQQPDIARTGCAALAHT